MIRENGECYAPHSHDTITHLAPRDITAISPKERVYSNHEDFVSINAAQGKRVRKVTRIAHIVNTLALQGFLNW